MKHYLSYYFLIMLTFLLNVSITTMADENQDDSLSIRERARHHDLALSIYRNTNDSVRTASINIGLLGGCEYLGGMQANLMTSFSRKRMEGVQIGGLSNLAADINGVQIASLGNISLSPFKGVQIAGITNISRGVKRGMQLSTMANISASYMRGLQLGSYNYSDTLNGSQIGVVNVCVSHPRGVQIGLVNYSRDTIAHKIGLVNINPKTRIDLMLFGGNSSKINGALRFRNRSTYNIIGVGSHYMGLDEKFSGAIYYRIGQYFNVSPRWTLSGDVGFARIETFQHNSTDKPERLYSLQARLNADYQISPILSAFCSVGYGDTRYYNHNRKYRSRPVVETGIALRYDRNANADFSSLHKDIYTVSSCNDSTSGEDTHFAYNDQERKVKHPWRAALTVFSLNLGVNAFDRFILCEDYAKINLHSIHHNFKNGFVWDNDQFSTNLFAHPYHGGLYFNSARSNGLNFWESAPYAFAGSLMWELACETEPPAINDLMATTMGGICIGEVTNRFSDLVYDDRTRGTERFLRELLGTVICPMKGLRRIISGDAWRVRHDYYSYHDYEKLPIDLSVTVGDRYLADEGGMFKGEHNPFIDLMLTYGDALDTEEDKPYDYFTANMTFGLSSNQPLISVVHLLGKIWSKKIYEGKEMEAMFGLFQHFNYYDSEAVKDGSQKVPYRISEAASIGPGLIYRFPSVGNLGALEQRIFLSAILLGGSLSDYYNVIARDYNLGSGYSAKAHTTMEFPHFGKFTVTADFYNIYTWKGYEGKDIENIDPLYLNAQGDKSRASLLVISPSLQIRLKGNWWLDFLTSCYLRETKYKYHDNVRYNTFEVRAGVKYII